MVTEKISVGAHYGLRDWLSQRITALVITLYTLLVIALMFARGGEPMDYAAWRGLFDRGWFLVVSFVFLIAVYYHAWVGVRNILMDYIKPTGLRLFLQGLVICALIAYTGWGVQVLWGSH
jgi:succinate dehydrogenase / fumarate reductase, membrane anchor subunit